MDLNIRLPLPLEFLVSLMWRGHLKGSAASPLPGTTFFPNWTAMNKYWPIVLMARTACILFFFLLLLLLSFFFLGCFLEKGRKKKGCEASLLSLIDIMYYEKSVPLLVNFFLGLLFAPSLGFCKLFYKFKHQCNP